MAEYIDRANLIARIEYYVTHTPEGKGEHYAYSVVLNEVLNHPAADVAPVVHGRWDDSGRYTFPNGDTAVVCPNCGCALTESEYHLNNWNYCPVCGDKMDGGEEKQEDVQRCRWRITMEIKALIKALRRVSVETGSIACLGCGHEHNCGVHGCAIIREAADKLQAVAEFCERRSDTKKIPAIDKNENRGYS